MKNNYFITLLAILTILSFSFIVGCGTNATSGGGGTTNPLSHISTVDANGSTCFSLSLDSTKKPRILYHNYADFRVHYTKWNGSAWEELINRSANSYGASMALSDSDIACMAIYSGGDFEESRNDGISWGVLDSSANLTSYGGNSVAIDQAQNTHFSYYNQSDSSLRYAKFTYMGSTWTLSTIESDGDVGKYSSITINSYGSPEISYWDDTNDNIKCAKWTGTSWDISTVESGTASNLSSTSIALDTSNNPYITYRASNVLKCATYDVSGAEWIVQTVDTAPTSGQYASVKVDSNGNPWIAYAQGNGLWYASWEGASWILTSVEAGSEVGNFCSLALTASDEPRICYYGGPGVGLKYFWK